MKLVNPKRIIVEDFPKNEQQTVSKLGFIINSVFEQIGQILNKNLTITDNLNENLITVLVIVDSNGIPVTKTEFKVVLKGQCVGLCVVSAINQTSVTTFPTSAPFITYEQLTGGLINIKNVTGLKPNDKWQLTVRATGN